MLTLDALQHWARRTNNVQENCKNVNVRKCSLVMRRCALIHIGCASRLFRRQNHFVHAQNIHKTFDTVLHTGAQILR